MDDISKKKEVLNDLEVKQYELIDEKHDLDNKKIEIDKKIKRLKVNSRLFKTELSLCILSPFIAVGIASAISPLFEPLFEPLNREYKADTKTYNMETNEVVKNDINYLRADYNFKVNVARYFPWVKKQDGTGYIRDVLEYEYVEKGDNEDFDVNAILEKVEPKFYREESETLNEEETNEPEIFITETHIDKSDYQVRKSSTTVAILAVMMFYMYVLPRNLVKMFREYNPKEDKYNLKNAKITKRTIIERYEELGGKIVKFQEECQDKEFIDINPELEEVVKKYVKVKE